MSTQQTGGGMGFFAALTLIFITLKLTGFIDWSWVWVLAPLWIPALLVFVFAFALVARGDIKLW